MIDEGDRASVAAGTALVTGAAAWRTAAYFALKGRDRGCRLCKWTAQARRGADARVFGAGAMGVPAEGSLLDRSATERVACEG